MGLETVEIIIEMEEKFGIQIPDEETADLAVLGDLNDYLLENYKDQLKLKFGENYEVEVWGILRGVIKEQLGVEYSQLTRTAHIIHDLGAG